MSLEALRDTSVEPYENGRSWGRAGPYEWVSAIADFAVDPANGANAGVTDLALAALDGSDDDGLVRFDADLRLLRPIGGGNGKLLFVVPNRGILGGVPFSADAPFQFGPAEQLHPGDGFLLERGWTIAWCGWQWDVLRSPGLAGLTAPEVTTSPGWMRIEFRLDAEQPTHSLSDSSIMFTFADYPTADVDDAQAVLYQRLAPDAEPVALPRSSWSFSDTTTVELDGGFQPFHWYTLVYRSARCPVTGAGLLAVRDTVSFLRNEHALGYAFGFGISQSGRFLRQFLYEGRNLDEAGGVVFDGVFAHIASSRRGEFNHRYAQPGITHVIGFSNLPPYDTAGLLAPQRAVGGVPKLLLTNSSWEYWRGDGALVHADPETGQDLPDDPDARVYLLAGTDHIGSMPFKDRMPVANPVHTHDVSPVLRALFVALEEWVCEGVTPPDSAVPRWSEGTAATRPEVLGQFAKMPQVHRPDPALLNVTRDVDLGPAADVGVGRWPLRLGAQKAAVVSAVDADGNERAGVALPAVAVPVAAYTGWNPRRPLPDLPDVLYEFVGGKLPLLSGRQPPERAAYEAAVRAAAVDLTARRLLLEIDIARTVHEALEVYDSSATQRP